MLDRLNQRPIKKREGTRQSLFLELDRPALHPLPVERFDLAEWSKATVNLDYHIEFDNSFYSVPYQLTRRIMEVHATPTTIEIFHQGKRVALHVRTHKAYTAVTKTEHRPASHRAHLDWPPSRMVESAATVGPRSREVVEKILAAFPHPEMGYRSCLGIIRLGQRYPVARVEAAAERALTTGAVSYRSMDSILCRQLDQQPLNPPTVPRSPPATTTSAAQRTSMPGPPRTGLRPWGGSERRRAMLNQPTIDKLLAMRLEPMVETWRSFEQNESAAQLSFEEKLALMVDRLWTWR